jgi:hypothetical protein
VQVSNAVHRKSPLGLSLSILSGNFGHNPQPQKWLFYYNDEKMVFVMPRKKVQSMSLISVLQRLDAYNAQVQTLSSTFGGNDENKKST